MLPDDLTVADYPGLGVRLLKFFMWYAPMMTGPERPQMRAGRAGGRACAAAGVSFLMEPLVYHPAHPPGTAGFAAIKPDLVRRAVETFSDPALAWPHSRSRSRSTLISSPVSARRNAAATRR